MKAAGRVRIAKIVRSRTSERQTSTSLRIAAAFGLLATIGAIALLGCAQQKKPVIPRAAFVMREAERHAIEGRDTTRARVVYPEFVGARTPEALDSLRATVHELLVAPVPGRRAPAGSIATLLDGFVAYWNAEREARRLHEYWRFDRRVEVASDTFGVIAIVSTDRANLGSAGSPRSSRVVFLGADDGRRSALEVLEGSAADSADAVVHRILARVPQASHRR